MRRFLVPCLALFLSTTSALAIPSVSSSAQATPSTPAEPVEPASAWLMHHPVSIWDWGMNVLEQRTGQTADSLSRKMGVPLIGRASYLFKGNRIDIFLIAPEGLGETTQTCEGLRQDFLGALLKLNDPESLTGFAETFMQDAFSHAGYAEKSRPKSIAREIVDMTQVHVAIAGTPPDTCDAPLSSWTLSEEIP